MRNTWWRAVPTRCLRATTAATEEMDSYATIDFEYLGHTTAFISHAFQRVLAN
jgi:hypothetical protein